MKTKDMPSGRARKTSFDAMSRISLENSDMRIASVRKEIQRAYMAGYRHGRKMKEKA